MSTDDTSTTAAAGPALSEGLGPLPEPTQGLGAHRWAYSADDMLRERAAGRERCEKLRRLLAEAYHQTRHPDYDWPPRLLREVDEALWPNGPGEPGREASEEAGELARLRDDLRSCRGTVKTELNHYERLAVVHGKTPHGAAYEAEAQRLGELLERIDRLGPNAEFSSPPATAVDKQAAGRGGSAGTQG